MFAEKLKNGHDLSQTGIRTGGEGRVGEGGIVKTGQRNLLIVTRIHGKKGERRY